MIQYFSSQGGSGASLNYSVVGLAGIDPPPGKENRIWVNTNVPIPGHIFSVEAPSGSDMPEGYIPEGFVWFATGSESSISFSPTQKNPIMVYPQTCLQFINNNWVIKEAESYMRGDWHDWIVTLFKPRNDYEEITGGYEGHAVQINGAPYQTAPTFDIITGETQRLIEKPNQRSGAIVTKHKINLTSFSQIQFDITIIENVNSSVWVYVTQDAGTAPPVADRAQIRQVTSQVTSLDIDNLEGNWYVAIGLYTASPGGTEWGAIQARVNSITMS